MKKIRKICLNDNQVMKNEEMGQVVAGETFFGQWQCDGCHCTNIGDRDEVWRKVDSTKINWDKVQTGASKCVAAGIGAVVAPYTLIGGVLAGTCYYAMLEGYSEMKEAWNSHFTVIEYAYQQLQTLTPIKTHVVL